MEHVHSHRRGECPPHQGRAPSETPKWDSARSCTSHPLKMSVAPVTEESLWEWAIRCLVERGLTSLPSGSLGPGREDGTIPGVYCDYLQNYRQGEDLATRRFSLPRVWRNRVRASLQDLFVYYPCCPWNTLLHRTVEVNV